MCKISCTIILSTSCKPIIFFSYRPIPIKYDKFNFLIGQYRLPISFFSYRPIPMPILMPILLNIIIVKKFKASKIDLVILGFDTCNSKRDMPVKLSPCHCGCWLHMLTLVTRLNEQSCMYYS